MTGGKNLASGLVYIIRVMPILRHTLGRVGYCECSIFCDRKEGGVGLVYVVSMVLLLVQSSFKVKYCCDILKNAFHYTENSNKHPYQQLQVFNSMFVFSDKCCGHARSIGDGSKSMFESTVI